MKKFHDRGFLICTDHDMVVNKLEIVSEIRMLSVKRLWQSVVVTAFLDALSPSKQVKALLDKKRAIAWLLSGEGDFVEVCDNAGFNSVLIREKARVVLEQRKNQSFVNKRYRAKEDVMPS